ncbi:hypothetical protein HPP92_004154 [Vanilla planifolia]|uniref:Myosin motor domain-containing protein n=1 Tax=Vanilla planifolia TaxID=51239 RepID=A0A835VJM6_VANPL|nr:hypothetical protein HPP92_004154 [Vanilla planifolia]
MLATSEDNKIQSCQVTVANETKGTGVWDDEKEKSDDGFDGAMSFRDRILMDDPIGCKVEVTNEQKKKEIGAKEISNWILQDPYSNIISKCIWVCIIREDNQDILDLIEKKPVGIVSLLDEACMFPKATHDTFAMKLFQSFPTHPRLEKAKFSKSDFSLSHYAGKVLYQTSFFLDKNRDYVVAEHWSLLSSSRCSFISRLFASVPEEPSRSSYKFSSVASRFKQQLQALMETLNSMNHIMCCCIKPNSSHCPRKFENRSVLHQLRCGGVLEAVRISLAGYPTRRTYSEFVDRFGILASEHKDQRLDEKTLTERILRKLQFKNFQLGKSKVFLRAGQIAILDARRNEILDKAAKLIQCYYRRFFAHRVFHSQRMAAITIQAFYQGYLSRSLFKLKKTNWAATLIQKYIRRWLSRHAFLHLHSATLLIQSSIRIFSKHLELLHWKEQSAAIFIQAHWKMLKACSTFKLISVQCNIHSVFMEKEGCNKGTS